MIVQVFHNGSIYNVECSIYRDTVGDYYGSQLEVEVERIVPLPLDYYEREEIEDIAISSVVRKQKEVL